MSWLHRIAQANDLNTLLTEVAQGIGDINAAEQQLQGMPQGNNEVCQLINFVGATHGADASMGRLARAAGCIYDPQQADPAQQQQQQNMMMAPMPSPAGKSMEIPSIEIE